MRRHDIESLLQSESATVRVLQYREAGGILCEALPSRALLPAEVFINHLQQQQSSRKQVTCIAATPKVCLMFRTVKPFSTKHYMQHNCTLKPVRDSHSHFRTSICAHNIDVMGWGSREARQATSTLDLLKHIMHCTLYMHAEACMQNIEIRDLCKAATHRMTPEKTGDTQIEEVFCLEQIQTAEWKD